MKGFYCFGLSGLPRTIDLEPSGLSTSAMMGRGDGGTPEFLGIVGLAGGEEEGGQPIPVNST
jgi:hypothetical protein